MLRLTSALQPPRQGGRHSPEGAMYLSSITYIPRPKRDSYIYIYIYIAQNYICIHIYIYTLYIYIYIDVCVYIEAYRHFKA